MPATPTRRHLAAARWIPLALLLGCGGGDAPTESGGGPPPTPTPVVASVDVGAPATSLLVGATLTLSATPRTAAGTAVSGAPVSWNSSNTAVATVSAAGVVTGVAIGTVSITASSNGHQDAVALTIRGGGAMTSAGGTIGTSSSTVMLNIPAGALATATEITIEPAADPTSNEHLVAGSPHEFGPDGTQFAQPVTLSLEYDPAHLPAGASPAALRIARYTGGRWQIIEEGAGVDAANHRVSATIRSFSSYAIVNDPCVIGSLGLGTTGGRISTNDCLYEAADRHSDYYTFSAPAGEVITVSTSGSLQGVVGIKQDTRDPAEGTVWLSGEIGGTMRLVSNGDPVQLFVSGQDEASVGTYSITRGNAAVAHSCDTGTYLMPGVSLSQTLNEANSCVVPIEFPAVEAARGKPLHAHYYGVKLEAGRTYTITITGLGSSFDPGLAVFAGGPVASSLPDGQIVSSRSVTITPATTRYHVIEVGSGKFTDGTFTTWINQSGSYALSVSR